VHSYTSEAAIAANILRYPGGWAPFWPAPPRNRRLAPSLTPPAATVAGHLESYTPGQDQAKSSVPVCSGMYRYVQVYASTGILVQYVLVCTAMYQKHDMRVSHTCRQLFESKLKQRTAPMQEIC
jgi:hypothetical protein